MKKLITITILCFMNMLVFSQTTDTLVGVGDYSWTAPAGVTQVTINLWGTGGNGGLGGGGGYGGSGGGGGGYSKKINLTVIPLTTYAVHIGSAGGTVYFKNSSTVLANCGVSGLTGPVPDPLAGGLGGSLTGAVGDITTSGGNGGEWSNTYGSGGSGGGSGGAGGNGGNGGVSPSFSVGGPGGTAGTGVPSGAVGADGVGLGSTGIAGTIPGGGGSGPGNLATPSGAGGSGMVCITYTGATTSVNNVIEEMPLVSVFPNPSSGQFLLTSNPEIEQISVFTLQGKKIMEIENINATFSTIDISEYAKGMYMLKIISKDKEVIKKIVKQ